MDESDVFNPAWVFLDNFPAGATDLLGDLAIPDLATSLIPVIARFSSRASSTAHMVLFGDKTVLESAIVSTSHPSALPLVRGLSIDHQLIYMILNHLINHDDVVRTLEKPKTELDQFFNAGTIYCFSLGPDFLKGIIESTPKAYSLALIQSIFRAALFLGNGPILNVVMIINRGDLANRSVLLGGAHYQPVQYTTYFGHLKATQALLDHGADPNLAWEQLPLSSIGSRTFPQKLSKEEKAQILNLLLSRGVKIDLYQAQFSIMYCGMDEIRAVLDYCMDKSFERSFIHHTLPLILARKDWDDAFSRTVEIIIKRASSDGVGHEELWNSVLSESLSCAVLRNHASAVDVLLKMGARPNVNCLVSAARSNNLSIFEDFLNCGLDPNCRRSKPFPNTVLDPCRDDPEQDRPDEKGTALSEAIKNPSRGVFQVLRARGVISKLAEQPDGFVAALVAACQVGDTDLIEHLLSLRSLPWKLAGIEKVLEAALEENQYHVVDKLLSVGLMPTIKCLELAVQNKQLATVKILVSCMDLSAQLERSPHYYRGFDQLDGTHYENIVIFGALQWGDQAAIEHVLSMDYPVDTLSCLDQRKHSLWDLAPELYAPGYASNWFLTPLSAAILKNNRTATNALLRFGAQAVSFRSQTTSYQGLFRRENRRAGMILTPVAACAIRGEVSLIKELLRIGVDPFDDSALLICAMLDLPDIVMLLLSAFKSRYPDGMESFGCDALYQIIRRKNLRLFGLLANEVNITGRVEKDRGPRPSPDRRPPSNTVFTSPFGEAIRLHAETSGADGMLDCLISLLKDHNAIVYRDLKLGNMTGLLYAISLDSLETVKTLFQASAKMSLPILQSINRTPLQAAAQVGSREIVAYLLSQGVSANEPPSIRAGATALQLAAISGNIAVARLLLEAGADINAPPGFGDGRTAFEGATEHGRITMMIFLVDEGADLLANSDAQYRRAIACAEENRQYAAKDLADKLFARALASQQAGFLGMGEPWAEAEMPDFGTLFS